MRKGVIAIMGATGSGKSALAMKLAEKFSGELISADSAQVYCGADIGTAKPTLEEMARIPHHLVNIRTLKEGFSLADFMSLCDMKVKEIWAREHLPIIVGGTGLYVRGYLEGYTLIDAPPDPALRQELSEMPIEALMDELRAKDPEAAAAIDSCNKRRVVRAVEVMRQSGRPFSECSKRNPKSFPVLKLGMSIEREKLCQRIDKRLERMLKDGWLEEVRRLCQEGFAEDLRRLRILGYPELIEVCEGKRSIEEAAEEIAMLTKRFAKRQATWLRSERELQQVRAENAEAEAIEALESFLADNN